MDLPTEPPALGPPYPNASENTKKQRDASDLPLPSCLLLFRFLSATPCPSIRFRREMAESKTLGEAILVPQVYTDLNTRYILVTEWVEGVKVRGGKGNTQHTPQHNLRRPHSQHSRVSLFTGGTRPETRLVSKIKSESPPMYAGPWSAESSLHLLGAR